MESAVGTKDIDFFMEHPDEFDKLSAEDQAKVFEGRSIEGEISSVPPDAAAQTASEPEGGEEVPEPGEAGDKPAVLAKDGKHLIPFEELETAREQARQWKQRAEEAAALAEKLRNAGEGQQNAGAPQPADIDLDDLEMQAEEASVSGEVDTYRALRKQINAEIERRIVARTLEAVEQREAQERQRAVQVTVQTEASKAVAQYPFLDHQGPNPNWEAIAQVQALRDLYAENGTPMAQALANAVAKVAPMYAEPSKPALAQDDITAKAAAAIAKARSTPPNSMSSIPSASIPHHDEATALLEMNSMELSEKFASMTPEQIEKALARML